MEKQVTVCKVVALDSIRHQGEAHRA